LKVSKNSQYRAWLIEYVADNAIGGLLMAAGVAALLSLFVMIFIQ